MALQDKNNMLTELGHSQSTRFPAFYLSKKVPGQLQELGLNLGKQRIIASQCPQVTVNLFPMTQLCDGECWAYASDCSLWGEAVPAFS